MVNEETLGPAVGTFGRRLAGALVLALLCLAGCGNEPEYAPGCYLNEQVQSVTRGDIETAASRFYGRLRSRAYDQALSEGSRQLQSSVSRDQLMQVWRSVAEVLTVPSDFSTEEIAVAVFPEGMRGPQEIECIDQTDSDGTRTMITTDQPFQAYLIQSAVVAGNHYNFSSIWYFEEGDWKLATFGVKPRKLLARDADYYLDLARAQRDKDNRKNAALLYNIAMDLLVPAPWVKPDRVMAISNEQRELRIRDLPWGRRIEWITLDESKFYPYLVAFDVHENALAVKISYEVLADADPTDVASEAPKLLSFVKSEFPEYGEVFANLILEATTTIDHEPVWRGEFSLRGGP